MRNSDQELESNEYFSGQNRADVFSPFLHLQNTRDRNTCAIQFVCSSSTLSPHVYRCPSYLTRYATISAHQPSFYSATLFAKLANHSSRLITFVDLTY